MSRIKRYPPWFAAIHAKSEEARKNGMSYGQYVAYEWDMAGRPRSRVHAASDDEEITDYPTAARTNLSDKQKAARAARAANKEKYGASQAVIREVRERMGLSKSRLSMLIDVSPSAIRCWELGYYPAQWDKLVAAMPELAEYVPEGGGTK